MKDLRDRQSVAQQAFEDVLARRDSAVAELDGACREVSAVAVALQQAEDDLKNCALGLPIAKATISRKYVESGERVQAGQPILQVMDLSGVRVAFGVPDTKINQFRIGQTLTVMADAFPGERFTGRVFKILPTADLRTRSFEIEVTIDETARFAARHGGGLDYRPAATNGLAADDRHRSRRNARRDDGFCGASMKVAARWFIGRRVELDGVYDNRIRLRESGCQPAGRGRGDRGRGRIPPYRGPGSPCLGDPGTGVPDRSVEHAMTTSQFFVYKRPVAWTLLVATLVWGYFAYRAMPQRHDPIIPIRIATVVTIYPGADAEKVEREVTRKVERQVALCEKR